MKKINRPKLITTSALIMLSLTLNSLAINYTISFTGTGASTTVQSVVVQNLTKGTTVTVPAGNTLNLVSTIVTSVENTTTDKENLRIFQNRADGKSTVFFYARQAGSIQLNVFSIDGRKVASINHVLQEGTNSFKLILPVGVFVIEVLGNDFKYTSKIVNSLAIACNPTIEWIGTMSQVAIVPQKAKSETTGITQMVYAIGDQLLYKGVSGNYSTIVTDVPIATKTTNFNFVACQDGDGNNYTIVSVGNQTWMAENLKTTKYRNGNLITNLFVAADWAAATSGAWLNYKNDVANGTKYGKLYNWYAVNDSRKIAPTGWHVATDAEWTTLENYVFANQGTSISVAKALAANINWSAYTSTGSVGNNLSINNYSGFSALPGGFRTSYSDGVFRNVGSGGYWWSSTSYDTSYAWYRELYCTDSTVSRDNYPKASGFSVRCVRDL